MKRTLNKLDDEDHASVKRPRRDESELVAALRKQLNEKEKQLAEKDLQLAEKDQKITALELLLPSPPTDVNGESTYVEHAMVTWDRNPLSATRPLALSIGAIDAVTNERLEDLSREDGNAIGSLIVDRRLTAGRIVRFFVAPLLGPELIAHGCSELSGTVTIGHNDFSAVRLNKAPVLHRDGIALESLLDTPRRATHGAWSSSYHIGVMRSMFVRSMGLIRIPRLGKRVKARSPHLLNAIASCVNCNNVMRSVLRYATPYCTLTDEECRDVIDNVYNCDDDASSLLRWLAHGVDPNTVESNGVVFDGSPSLLFLAAYKGFAGVVDLLLENGAEVDKATTDDDSTPLYIAAQKGHIDIVEKLIAAGCDVDKARIDIGVTPLNIAAQKGHVDAVEKLIAAGCDVDKATTDNGITPLFIAAQKGHIDIVEKLIAAGCDVDKARTDNGATPLYIAAQEGHVDVVKKLIAAGCDVDKARIDIGVTPLIIAAQKGHIDIVEKLIAAGCDVDKARTDIGVTPLIIAAQEGHVDVVENIIAAGCDVDKAETNDGCTPLFMAAQEGHIDVVKKLLENGADKSIRGFQNRTPLVQARRNGHDAIVALLA